MPEMPDDWILVETLTLCIDRRGADSGHSVAMAACEAADRFDAGGVRPPVEGSG